MIRGYAIDTVLRLSRRTSSTRYDHIPVCKFTVIAILLFFQVRIPGIIQIELMNAPFYSTREATASLCAFYQLLGLGIIVLVSLPNISTVGLEHSIPSRLWLVRHDLNLI